MKVSIIGLGWYGLPLAEELVKKYRVLGTKSSLSGARDLEGRNFEVLHLDLNEGIEDRHRPIFEADALVLNVPPGMRSEPLGSGGRYLDWMSALLENILKSPIKKLVFISSTGVFGDDQHEVDEGSDARPTSESGRVLRKSEILFESFRGDYAVIRPGGLVGGDRHPVKYLAGRAGIKGKLHPVNLVHRQDLIRMTAAILQNHRGFNIYHAVAPHHPAKGEYYTEMALKCGLKKPMFDDGDLSIGKLVHSSDSATALDFKYEFDQLFKMLPDGSGLF